MREQAIAEETEGQRRQGNQIAREMPMSDGDRAVGNGEGARLLEVGEHVVSGGPEDEPPAEAWRRLQAAWNERLRRLAAEHGLRAAEADDVIQQVWLEVGKRLRQRMVRMEPHQFGGWLKKVLWSKVVDLYRHRARHPAQALGDAIGSEWEPTAREEDPNERSDREGRARRARNVARRLVRQGDKDARIILLHHVKGWATAEVAAALDLTSAQVRDGLWRGTRKIKAALGLDPRPGRRRPRRGSAQGG